MLVTRRYASSEIRFHNSAGAMLNQKCLASVPRAISDQHKRERTRSTTTESTIPVHRCQLSRFFGQCVAPSGGWMFCISPLTSLNATSSKVCLEMSATAEDGEPQKAAVMKQYPGMCASL